jgi:hypothetical protein
MYESVMMPAQRDAVVSVGRPTVLPRHDVMNVCPSRRPIAAGEGASAVPQDNGGSRLAGVWAATATEVDRHAGPIQHRRQDASRACESTGRRHRQLRAGVELPERNVAPECIEVDGHVELWRLSTVGGQAIRRECEAAHIDQRIGPACGGGPQIGTVFAARWLRQRFKSRLDNRRTFGVEESADPGAAEAIRRECEPSALLRVLLLAIEPVAQVNVGQLRVNVR